MSKIYQAMRRLSINRIFTIGLQYTGSIPKGGGPFGLVIVIVTSNKNLLSGNL